MQLHRCPPDFRTSRDLGAAIAKTPISFRQQSVFRMPGAPEAPTFRANLEKALVQTKLTGIFRQARDAGIAPGRQLVGPNKLGSSILLRLLFGGFMRLILPVTLLISLYSWGGPVTSGFQDESVGIPSTNEERIVDVVMQYCTLSSNEGFEEIPKLTIAAPSRYIFGPENGTKLDSQPVDTLDTGRSQHPSPQVDIMDISPDDHYLEQQSLKNVNDEMPRLFQQNNVYIKRIVGLSIKGDGASAVVEVGSRTNGKYKGKEEFLLLHSKGDWKIFCVRYFSELDAKNDLWPLE